jgi:hypothetical protein
MLDPLVLTLEWVAVGPVRIVQSRARLTSG